MRRRPRWSPLGFACLLALAFSVARGAVAEATAEKKGEAKAKITFAPEVETKFKEFFKKLTEAKRKHGVERMKLQIEEVKKITGLDAEGAKALEKPAQEAADLSGKAWLAKTEELWRKQMNLEPDQMIEALEQALPQIEAYAQGDYFGAESDPVDHAAWTEALERVLTPAQATVWNKTLTDRKQAVLKEFGDLLKRSVEGVRDRQQQALLAKSAELKLSLGLSEERGKTLDALAKSVTEKSMQTSRTRAEKVVLAMTDLQRRQIAKQGNFYFALDEGDALEQQAAWKDGLAQLLSPEEMKRLDNAREEKKTRRVRVLGQVMLALFDEKVAFTASQRQQLQPMAERLAKGEPSLFPEPGSSDYFSFSPQSFLSAGKKAAAPELEALLDPIQRKHWQEASIVKVTTFRTIARVKKTSPETKAEQPAGEPEPEYFEQVISDFLFEKTDAERKRVLGTMILKAEDAARVAALSPEATARLQTAARGAAEEALASWKTMTDEGLRSNLNEATPRNVKQRLEGMEEYQFRRGSSVVPEKRPVWEKTVQTELTEPQRVAWQKEVDERTAYREKAIASVILAEFDRKHTLAPDQWNKLEPMIATFMKEYSQDIGSMFSSSNSSPWYLQSYSMFIPFASIPEKEMKTILGKEQWDRWVGSNEFSNTSNYWDSIRGNHDRRVKVAK